MPTDAALVKTGNGIKTLSTCGAKLNGVPVFADLAAVVEEYFERLKCKK